MVFGEIFYHMFALPEVYKHSEIGNVLYVKENTFFNLLWQNDSFAILGYRNAKLLSASFSGNT